MVVWIQNKIYILIIIVINNLIYLPTRYFVGMVNIKNYRPQKWLHNIHKKQPCKQYFLLQFLFEILLYNQYKVKYLRKIYLFL